MKSKRKPATDPASVNKRTGDRIRALRQKAGYTSFEDFAHEHDIGSSQMGRYERGESDMRLSSLTRVLNGLNVTLAEFFSEGFE